MQQDKKSIILGICIGVAAFCVVAMVGVVVYLGVSSNTPKDSDTNVATENSGNRKLDGVNGNTNTADNGNHESAPEGVTLLNHKVVEVKYDKYHIDVTPSVEAYAAAPDMSNVYDIDRLVGDDAVKQLLVKNNFAVRTSDYYEMFEIYESNRYNLDPSFITTDSIMHTYHLYFSYLQKKTEKEYLINDVRSLSEIMLNNASAQYEVLKGTEWEDAAKKNVVFFGVACSLCGNGCSIPSYALADVDAELSKIYAAGGIDTSLVTNEYEDYSQYKPRGYYDGDETLEKYFRTMMWYGRINYTQEKDELNRVALLVNLAIDSEAFAKWEEIYSITSFFAGSSDDAGYYEYMPAIEAAYGKGVDVQSIIGNADAYDKYVNYIAQIDPPAINSVVFADDDGETDKNERAKGYRFMGQRFTLDGAIFNELIYDRVNKNGNEARMLPSGLDVPAALGSDTALDILVAEGESRFPNYMDQMNKTRDTVKNAPTSVWTSSLYGGWLYTLNPILDEKTGGYPSFMTNSEWKKKNLETYLGSWTELKHDTILYSKQVMAEMGGGDFEVFDDRGYVEPEPDVYGRLHALVDATIDGLSEYNLIAPSDVEGLQNLAAITDSLQKIAVKELQNQPLTDDEYEFIRCYGGNLEHLWYETASYGKPEGEYIEPYDNPMALVADVATDPNGSCLEVGIGGASIIYVLFPLDGKLHVGKGSVFTYYEFEQPLNNRLTDDQWRQKLGIRPGDDGYYRKDSSLKQPAWTESYRYTYYYDYNY